MIHFWTIKDSHYIFKRSSPIPWSLIVTLWNQEKIEFFSFFFFWHTINYNFLLSVIIDICCCLSRDATSTPPPLLADVEGPNSILTTGYDSWDPFEARSALSYIFLLRNNNNNNRLPRTFPRFVQRTNASKGTLISRCRTIRRDSTAFLLIVPIIYPHFCFVLFCHLSYSI